MAGGVSRGDAKRRVLHHVQAHFLQGRRVMETGQTLGTPGVEHAQLTGLDLWRNTGGVGCRHDVAAQDGRHQIGAALVGHMQQLQPQLLRDQPIVRCGLVSVPVAP